MYELAAKQGDTPAQYNLGLMYYNSEGVDQSYERAKEYFEAAVRQGMADAQYSLGGLYYNGEGVKKSKKSARVWFTKAAEQGHQNSILMLQRLDKQEEEILRSILPFLQKKLAEIQQSN